MKNVCIACEGVGYHYDRDLGEITGDCPDCNGTGKAEEVASKNYPRHNEYRVELTFVVPEDWHVPADVMEYADELWLRHHNEAPVGSDYVLAYIERQLLQHSEVRIPNISVGKYVFLARSIHLSPQSETLF